MLKSAECLSKFDEGFSSHYSQLYFSPLSITLFPFILYTVYHLSVYSLQKCTLYSYDSPLLSTFI